MSLLQLLENGSNIPRVKSIALNESAGMSAKAIYEKCIAQTYRAQRKLINESNPNDFSAKTAARQARAMLSMQGPLVMKPDLKQIKDLAIKQWNESFSRTLSKIRTDEANAHEEAMSIARGMMGGDLVRIDAALADRVLDMARQIAAKIIKTATSAFRVVQYAYRGEKFVAIESPDKTIEIFRPAGE